MHDFIIIEFNLSYCTKLTSSNSGGECKAESAPTSLWNPEYIYLLHCFVLFCHVKLEYSYEWQTWNKGKAISWDSNFCELIIVFLLFTTLPMLLPSFLRHFLFFSFRSRYQSQLHLGFHYCNSLQEKQLSKQVPNISITIHQKIWKQNKIINCSNIVNILTFLINIIINFWTYCSIEV